MKTELANQETEQFCREIAEQYQKCQASANLKFIEFVRKNNPLKWEVLAMQDRIRYLVHRK